MLSFDRPSAPRPASSPTTPQPGRFHAIQDRLDLAVAADGAPELSLVLHSAGTDGARRALPGAAASRAGPTRHGARGPRLDAGRDPGGPPAHRAALAGRRRRGARPLAPGDARRPRRISSSPSTWPPSSAGDPSVAGARRRQPGRARGRSRPRRARRRLSVRRPGRRRATLTQRSWRSSAPARLPPRRSRRRSCRCPSALAPARAHRRRRRSGQRGAPARDGTPRAHCTSSSAGDPRKERYTRSASRPIPTPSPGASTCRASRSAARASAGSSPP